MHKRQEMLSNLRAREKQMASSLNMTYAANRFVLSDFILLPYLYRSHYVMWILL